MNKSEIALKIKNTIQEKLRSLQAYVDKELPEYILVMVANKKSKELMANDLKLFLGEETNTFIEWLHDFLEKCQSNPEDAFRNNGEKQLKPKSNNSSEKKKKSDKDKQKLKSKSRKSDEKKDHKKNVASKASKNASRSPKAEITSRSSDIKNSKSKVTPEKQDIKPTDKQFDLVNQKEDKNISEKPEPKKLASIASTVKVTERPVPKKDLFKSSIEMIQRDLKEAEADINIKIEPIIIEKPIQRSSVFTRLGTNELKKKSSSKIENETHERIISPLKRSYEKTSEISDERDTRDSKIKRVESDIISPNFIVTLNGLDKLNIPLTSRLGPKRNLESMETIDDEDMYDIDVVEKVGTSLEAVIEQDMKENHNSAVEQQSTRCKFWPTCKNKETCPFIHPTEPCKMFPNCKFGALCLYIHPNCRFTNNCTKTDCPYTHYGPRVLVPGEFVLDNRSPVINSSFSSRSVPTHSLPRCAYYPNCNNVNCKFFHPTLPCRFGLSCKLKDSCMYYHPAMPKIAELKWVASATQQAPQNMLESTSTKKSEIQSV